MPNVPAAVGFAVAVAALWLITVGGSASDATAILCLLLLLIGLPFSTRYSFRTLRHLDRHRSASTASHRVRMGVVLLALLLNAWIIFMVGGYALIVFFSILNGGPIVASRGFEVLGPGG